jgi:hypothetical protein
VDIFAGATNTSSASAGQFLDGRSLNANVTVTYTGLTIKGGSGSDLIENDAKKGIVTDGNAPGDVVVLGGANAKATLGTGTSDHVDLGFSLLGTSEAAGSALGDKVTFSDAATAFLFMGVGTEAGSTAGTTSIGLTKVLNAAAGMKIDFAFENPSNKIVETPSGTTLTATENAAVAALAGPGVAHFSFRGNEYLIATSNHEMAVGSGDTIVELVGITSFHSPSLSGSVVTLA